MLFVDYFFSSLESPSRLTNTSVGKGGGGGATGLGRGGGDEGSDGRFAGFKKGEVLGGGATSGRGMKDEGEGIIGDEEE